MAERALSVSVVIPHLNAPEALAKCLDGILAGTCVPDEILVVDNGTKDMPDAVCERDARIRLLRETEPGPGPARNTGSAAACGDILAFIDCDCVPDEKWLAVAMREMAREGAAILGGAVEVLPRDPARRSALESYEAQFAYRMDRYVAEQGFTGTGNMVVRRDVFVAVGPFAGITVAEDRDWGHRARSMGYTLRYCGEMVVYHPARRCFAQLAAKWDRQLAHDYNAARKRAGGRLRFALKGVLLLASPIAEIPSVIGSPRLTGGREWLGAFAVLTRIRWHRAWTMARLVAGADPGRLTKAWNQSGTK